MRLTVPRGIVVKRGLQTGVCLAVLIDFKFLQCRFRNGILLQKMYLSKNRGHHWQQLKRQQLKRYTSESTMAESLRQCHCV